jgi:hypothetical protein
MEAARCCDCSRLFRRSVDEQWKRRCYACWKANHEAKPATPAPVIPPEMLRRLIYLTHPDKHNGSTAATLATQWLLEQKNRLEGRA